MAKKLYMTMVFVFVAGVAFSGGEQESTGGEKTFKLDYATPFANDGPAGVAMKKLAEDVNRKTKGTIEISIFTDGALGSGNDNLASLKSGELDMGVNGMEGLDMFAPEFTFLSSPFLLTSWEQLGRILASDIGAGLRAKFEANNIKPLAYHFRDIRVFASNREILKPTDVAGLKLRLPLMKTYVDAWGRLNVVSTTIAMGELYTALQTGTAEACEGGYEQMVTLKIYEVQKYIADSNHVFDHAATFIHKPLFESMSSTQQAILNESAKEAMAYADKLATERLAGYKKQCLDGGMKLMNFDRQAFSDALAEYNKNLFKTKWPGFTYEQIMKYK
ncbi:MAG: TRAP transporter substrate-binding protein [Spirochaetia bacterium]|nr:TRAP transporter substrate-binding protein [Spirochaetia bacterium]